MTLTLHNRARGEVILMIDNAPHRLCLTLGALAELEAAFDVNSIAEIGARLKTPSSQDLLIVVLALLGGEASGFDLVRLSRASIAPDAAAKAVAEAFRLAFDDV
jgi:hypothetical protein